MKKFDFSLGDGREVLSREQMKSVTGGLLYGGSQCVYSLSNGAELTADCSGSVSSCRAFAEHGMHASEIAYGGTYVGGSLHCYAS